MFALISSLLFSAASVSYKLEALEPIESKKRVSFVSVAYNWLRSRTSPFILVP